jgi:AAA+ superfamily predicted ATPase
MQVSSSSANPILSSEFSNHLPTQAKPQFGQADLLLKQNNFLERLADKIAPTPDQIKQAAQANQVKGFFSRASGVVGTVSGALLPFSNLLTAASTFTNTFFGHALNMRRIERSAEITKEAQRLFHEQKTEQNYQVAASAAAIIGLSILGAAKGMAWVNAKRIAQKLEGTHRIIDQEKIKEYHFKDVVGHNDIKQLFQGEFLSRIKHPEFFPKDKRFAILHGPPGTGKTLLAKCLANEAGIPFIEVHLTSLSEKNVKEFRLKLEQHMEKNGPAVILMDELNSLQTGAKASPENIKVMNEILQLLDGVTSLKNAFVIGTTNHLEQIDEALISRACRKSAVEASDRLETFERYLQKEHLLQHGDVLKLIPPDNLNMNHIFQASEGFAGRDVENTINNLIGDVVLKNLDSLKAQREAVFTQHVPPPPGILKKLASFFVEFPPPPAPSITYKIPFTESQLLAAIKQVKVTDTSQSAGIKQSLAPNNPFQTLQTAELNAKGYPYPAKGMDMPFRLVGSNGIQTVLPGAAPAA